MPGDKASLPLGQFIRRHSEEPSGAGDDPAGATLERVRSALRRVAAPGYRFRAGLVGGKVYLEAGRAPERLPGDPYPERPVKWSPRKWFVIGQTVPYETARCAFESARYLAECELAEAFEFDGDAIFRKR